MPDDQSTDLQTSRIGSFDPETGERTYREFKYRPGPISKPIQPSPMDSLMRAAQQVYQTAPLEDAEKAVSAAIQYQGLRAYQRDLAGGMSANEALVRNGPMMFYQKPSAIAPMVRATAPGPSVATVPIPGGGQAVTYGNTMQIMRPPPSITPYQQESLKIQRERMAAQQPKSATEAFQQRLDLAEYNAAIAQAREARKALDSPDIPESGKKEFQDTLDDALRTMSEIRNKRSKPAPTVAPVSNSVSAAAPSSVAPSSTSATVPAASATAQGKPALPKVGDVYKGYYFKGGDPAKKESWEKSK